jgi:hypothetical protein
VIRCSLGHDHVYAGSCERDSCQRCHADCDERPCDVAQYTFDAAPDCCKTFYAFDTGFLTGFTTRAASALIHLREAWCVADQTNRIAVAFAIASLLLARSLDEDRANYVEFLRWSLDDKRADELLLEVEAASLALAPARDAVKAERDRHDEYIARIFASRGDS